MFLHCLATLGQDHTTFVLLRSDDGLVINKPRQSNVEMIKLIVIVNAQSAAKSDTYQWML